MTSATPEPFIGAKLMLFFGDRVLVLRRDDIPTIPWPGYLDFPGGGREGNEAPVACALRETHEEIALKVAPALLSTGIERMGENGRSWFFAAHLGIERLAEVRLGNEGTGWRLVEATALCDRSDMIPHFAAVLRRYLNARP